MTKAHYQPLVLTGYDLRERVSDTEIATALGHKRFERPLHFHDAEPRDHPDRDWRAAQRALAAWWEAQRPLLAQHPERPLAFFGLAPVPLLLDLGYRIADTRALEVFGWSRSPASWAWPGRPPGEPVPRPVLSGLPTERDTRPGDVVLRVSASYPIDASQTEPSLQDRLATVDLRLDAITLDPFRTPEELRSFVACFGEALAAIDQLLPRCRTLHLFVAGPAGMCVLLGSKLNRTIFPRVQVYQFLKDHNPPYLPAFRLGRCLKELDMKTKVHFLAADASRLLDIQEEFRQIKQRLQQEGAYRERLELVLDTALEAQEIQAVLDRNRAQIVHFSGHGLAGGVLLVRDAASKAPRELAPKALVGLFRILNRDGHIRLVVLNACHSLPLAEALTREGVVPAVVGMNKPIPDAAAIAFSDSLYRSLADGGSIERAFDLAVNQIELLHGETKAEIPELRLAPGASRTTTLFDAP